MDSSHWLGAFPPYPGARPLGSQHVNGGPGGVHVLWTAWATADPPGQVAAFYGLTLRDGSATLSAGRDKRLSVHPVGGTYPRCDVPPAADDRTVLIVSQAIGLE